MLICSACPSVNRFSAAVLHSRMRSPVPTTMIPCGSDIQGVGEIAVAAGQQRQLVMRAQRLLQMRNQFGHQRHPICAVKRLGSFRSGHHETGGFGVAG